MANYIHEDADLDTEAGCRRLLAEGIECAMTEHGQSLPEAKDVAAKSWITGLSCAGLLNPDRHYNAIGALMNIDDAVAERKAVLESADLARYLRYCCLDFPKDKASQNRLWKQFMKEVAECPYVDPVHRATARAHLPKPRPKRKQ